VNKRENVMGGGGMNRERWNKWKNLIGRKEESSEEREGRNKIRKCRCRLLLQAETFT
jgi:hypothetical protein